LPRGAVGCDHFLRSLAPSAGRTAQNETINMERRMCCIFFRLYAPRKV
jgi:hypothetical protein